MKKTAGLIALVIFFASCKKTEQVVAPIIPVMATITTTPISAITTASATAGGNITSDGGAVITARGLCYGKATNPTIANTFVAAGAGTGNFTVELKVLKANTTYYVRAFATNSAGTSYGATVAFTTQIPNKVTDIDGNIYHTVKIGKQVWMVENLKTKKYRDGTPLPLVTGNYEWVQSRTGSYCYYNIDASLAAIYGNLYNGYAIFDKLHKLAPAGWHIPTVGEWTTLINYLGGYEVAGSKLKEKGTAHWLSPNSDANDNSGFKALPGGIRRTDPLNPSLNFSAINNTGHWWSSAMGSNTTLGSYILYAGNGSVIALERQVSFGLYVRCIMD